MRPIATDKSDFEELRKAGQIYVDKTAYFHRLITDPCRRYFFCARPRRFGKSLGVTTLKSIFLGHREFFSDLAIAKTDYDFAPHTVLHFNWGGVYVFELKVDEPASAALAQVKAKNYDAPYRAKGLPVYAVGLSFDSKTRQLADAAAEELVA